MSDVVRHTFPFLLLDGVHFPFTVPVQAFWEAISPHFSQIRRHAATGHRHLRPSCEVLLVALGRVPDADDPPCDTEVCPAQFSSEILTRDDRQHWPSSVCLPLLALFSMPLTPGSLVTCRSNASASTRLILSSAACGPNRIALQQVFNSPPACFAVGFLSSLASSQVPASRATLTETPLFEVCSAKIGPRRFVLHQHLSWSLGHHLRRSRVFCPRPISLIAVPCSVTTTASDDEFSIPMNAPGWNRGSHFPPLDGLAGMYRIFCPNSRMGVCPFGGAASAAVRRCQCHTCSSGTKQTPPTSTTSLRRAGFWSQSDARAQLSVSWPDRQRAPLHVL